MRMPSGVIATWQAFEIRKLVVERIAVPMMDATSPRNRTVGRRPDLLVEGADSETSLPAIGPVVGAEMTPLTVRVSPEDDPVESDPIDHVLKP